MNELKDNEKRFVAKLESIYDALYARIDKVIKEENPCRVSVTGKLNKICVMCMERREKGKENTSNSLCCKYCRFLGPNGCIAIKPATCRAWLCVSASSKFPETEMKLEKLNQLLWEWNFWVSRGDKKASMNQSLERKSQKIIRLKKRFGIDPEKQLKFE